MKTTLQLPFLVIIMSLTLGTPSCEFKIRPQHERFYSSVVYGAPAGTSFRYVKRSERHPSYIILEENDRFYAMKYSAYYHFGRRDDYTHYEYYQKRKFEVTDQGNGEYKSTIRIFEESSSEGKDLEKMAALEEKRDHEKLVSSLIENYGLSEKRSHNVARLIGNWERIQNSRHMTSNDQDIFLKKVTGSDKSAWEKALKDKVGVEDLVEKASLVNNISPEQFKEILKDFLTE